MAAFLGRVERVLERAFEAPSRRLFRTRLQPVELARAIGRAMVAEGQVGTDALEVPNHYLLELHPSDFRRFSGPREALERDLAAYVLQQAQRRGWRCPDWPEVIVQAADDVPPGRPRVRASTVCRELAAVAPHSPAEALDGTSVLPSTAARPSRPAPRADHAWLELEDGRRVQLGADRLRIGRASDNDLVLNHDSVSRHHAEVRRERGRFFIADLGSTNGTRVNGQPIGETLLAPGALVHVGAVALQLHVAD
jgi:hypothetical protein